MPKHIQDERIDPEAWTVPSYKQMRELAEACERWLAKRGLSNGTALGLRLNYAKSTEETTNETSATIQATQPMQPQRTTYHGFGASAQQVELPASWFH